MVFFKRMLDTDLATTYPATPQIVCPFPAKRLVVSNEDVTDYTHELYVSFDGVNDHGHLTYAFTSTYSAEYVRQNGVGSISMWFRYAGTAPTSFNVMIEH